MTLTLYTGPQNSGKTLGLSVEAFKDWIKGREIYTNVRFAFPHIFIDKGFLLYIVENGINITDATFVLDEFWLWIDSRRKDTMLSYFYLQSSKDNLNVLMSAQTDRQIDVRLRENLHYWGECERYILYKNKMVRLPKKYRHMRKELPKWIQDILYIKVIINVPVNRKRRYSIFIDDFVKHKIKFIPAKLFYSLYDTTQKIKIKVSTK